MKLSLPNLSLGKTGSRFAAAVFTAALTVTFSNGTIAQDWDLSNSHPAARQFIHQAQTNPDFVYGPGELTRHGNVESLHSHDEFGPSGSFFDRGGNGATTEEYPGFGTVEGFQFRLTADALFLAKSAPSGGTFISDDTGDVLAYSDLGFDLGSGFQVAGQFYANDDTGFEFRALSSDNSLSRTEDGPNVTPVFFGGVPADPVNSYTVEYETDLQSFELNCWAFNSGRTRVGFGIRNMRLDEVFDVRRTFDPTIGVFSETENELWGAQFLVERRRYVGSGIHFQCGLKAGGYNNDVHVNAVSASRTIDVFGDEFSIGLDFTAGFIFDFNQSTRFRLGYQGLVLTEIATGAEQSEGLSLFDPNPGPIVDTVSFHGLHFGVTHAF